MAALMIAAPIGSLIAATLGLRYAMMLMAVPFLGATIVAFTLKEPKIKKKAESKRYLDYLLSGIKYFKGHRVLRILAFDRISIAVLIFFIIWTYQPKFMLLGVPILYFGFIHAIALTGMQIPFVNSFEKLEKLFRGKKNYLLWSAVIAGISFVIFGLTKSIWIALIALPLIAGFGLTRNTLFQNYLNKHIESYNRATVLSTISMLDRFVRALVYPLIGLLVEWSLNYALVIIGVLIVVFAFISRVREEHLID